MLGGLRFHDAVGEGYEDIFERGLDGLNLRLRKLRAKIGEMIIFGERVNGASEDGGLANAGQVTHTVE